MKTISNFLFSVFLLLCSTTLFGQLNHEIKFNLFGPFKGEYRPSYEILIKKNIGIEVEVSYESLKRRKYNWDINNQGTVPFFNYQHRRFEVTAAGKYYFSKTKVGYGYFVGFYTGLNYITKEDETFAESYEALFNRIPTMNAYKKGFNHIFYGLTGGYKFLIKERIITELSMKYVNIDYANTEIKGFDFDITWFVKIGYRF